MWRIAALFVRIFEFAVPDPYIFAAALTILTAILALVFAPQHSAAAVLTAWYGGIVGKDNIFQFALQMILILVTGYALANSRPIARALQALSRLPRTGKGAVTLTFLTSAIACWLNWGFGLVVAGLLAREIARRMRIDFGWLVAAAYSGFLIWASGWSSSIALAQSTPGNKLNIVQSLTGTVLPIQSMILPWFNIAPVLALLIVLPLLLRAVEPRNIVLGNFAGNGKTADRRQSIEPRAGAVRFSLADRLNNAWILNAIFAAAGLGFIIWTWTRTGFALDINSLILIFFCLGLLFHWTPIAYVRAVNDAAAITGPLIIQYPIYGGIMGIMTATGLAGVIAQWFDTFASGATLPFWSYLSSIVISLFVPSGGGHWAVQGPFAVPAAIRLHASLPATAMGVAIGEEVANMVQPFWALPVLAIAGVGLQRVMAFTVISFVTAFVLFGASLLLLVPHATAR